MNTLFQISISGSVPVPPRTKYISEQRPHGSGFAHLPEVVFSAQLQDAIGRHELAPDVVRLGVTRNAVLALEDGDDETVLRHLPDVGEQLPREADRVFLEIVAEREVPQHLEEGVMPVRRPHVVEVVVLAADAHAPSATRPRACTRASHGRETRP